MSAAVERLRDPRTIRERAENVFAAPRHFEVRLERLPAVAARVKAVSERAYPDGSLPVHGRFRHFGNRLEKLPLHALPTDERARAHIDLVTVSVLLDAGAGTEWRYRDPDSGEVLARSEGLAVASLRLFESGAFSHRGRLEVTAHGLAAVDEERLAGGFQATRENVLVGLPERAALLRALGTALASRPDSFGDDGRPGAIFDHEEADAVALLRALLDSLSEIWPSRLTLDGEPLGDVWRHPSAGGEGASAGFVPFHKLTQWLTYSLVEPFALAGRPLARVDALTGLAEYRNGGLFVDLGVLVPLSDDALTKEYEPGDEIVVEWRAMTLSLLDRLAQEMALPLAQLLEAGTWRAGREAALEKRPDGSPPLHVKSDGTLF